MRRNEFNPENEGQIILFNSIWNFFEGQTTSLIYELYMKWKLILLYLKEKSISIVSSCISILHKEKNEARVRLTQSYL